MQRPDPSSVPGQNPGSIRVESVFRSLIASFREGRLATPELDARVLLCAGCGISHERLIASPERAVTAQEAMRLEDYRARRQAGEPVSRILGHREFRGLSFAISPQTLDPRPDTETLVEAALELARDMIRDTISASGPLRLLDLGTGSGCILVSLLHEMPQAEGIGCDISPGAVKMARANAEQNGVAARARFFCGSWADAVKNMNCGYFDIIVSNPPYILHEDIASLDVEVSRFDPHRGLDGGKDGLESYRLIASVLPGLLRPGGWAVLETGTGQSGAVMGILQRGGLGLTASDGRIWDDLSGQNRCVGACKA